MLRIKFSLHGEIVSCLEDSDLETNVFECHYVVFKDLRWNPILILKCQVNS